MFSRLFILTDSVSVYQADLPHLLFLKEWPCIEGVLWGPGAQYPPQSPDLGALGVFPVWICVCPPIVVGPHGCWSIGNGLTLRQCD